MNEIRTITIDKYSFEVLVTDLQNQAMWDDIEGGKFEPRTFEILISAIGENDVVLEIGIGGSQTAMMTSIVSKKLIAIEPDTKSLAYAQECLKLNPILREKTHLIHGALSNKRGTEIFGRGSNLFDDVHFQYNDPQLEVNTFQIEDLLEITESRISFINMDIEGGEYICLPAMKKWLQQTSPILLLSLHPGFLKSDKVRNENILRKYFRRLFDQYKIFISIRHYKVIYDVASLKRIKSLTIFSIKYLRAVNAHECQILCSEKILKIRPIVFKEPPVRLLKS